MKQLGTLAKRTWPLLVLLWIASLIASSLRFGFQTEWIVRALGMALFFWGLPVLAIGGIAQARRQCPGHVDRRHHYLCARDLRAIQQAVAAAAPAVDYQI